MVKPSLKIGGRDGYTGSEGKVRQGWILVSFPGVVEILWSSAGFHANPITVLTLTLTCSRATPVSGDICPCCLGLASECVQ